MGCIRKEYMVYLYRQNGLLCLSRKLQYGVIKRMKPLQKTDSLEGFMRRQEQLLKQNEFYKRLLIIPVIVITVSISVIAYNLTEGRILCDNRRQDGGAVLAKSEEASGQTSVEKINLNTATVDMLDSLPGIGPQKAGAIVKMRDKMGGFRTAEDILNVDGIGETILTEIQHMIYVENY